MNLLFLDFETFYTDEYSLRKMSPAEYILDQRFQANGCAFQEGLEGKPFWVDGPELPDYLKGINQSNTMAIGHNMLFDASILSWRYNFVPKLTCCTLSVAQGTLRYLLTSLSLDSLAKFLELGAKGSSALINVKGMDLNTIKQLGYYDAYVNYALVDVTLCVGVFKKLVLSGVFPMQELAILDILIRMTTQPVFVLDQGILAQHLNNVLVAKSRALEMVGSDVKSIRQDETFAEMLRSRGVDPPRKISLVTGKERYAFAKTDAEFLDLEEYPDSIVQALVAARLGAKSTIEETRAQRFINISNLKWPDTFEGNGYKRLMPMPVRFSAAHTHRGGGDWKLNVQNMTRGGELRKALRAPPGHKVLTVDASQIEARLTAWLAGEVILLEQFANGEDVYSNFATTIFGFPVSKANKAERYVGKQAILGLGFGLGAAKFQKRLKTDSKNQTGTAIDLAESMAQYIVNTYRTKFFRIPNTWRLLNERAIPILAGGSNGKDWDQMQLGPVVIEKGVIYMPGRLKMFYHDLKYIKALGEWQFTFAGKPKKIYGGKLLENIIQYLDRILVFDAAMRIQKRISPYRLAQQAHDENGYVVREEHVEAVKAILLEEMTRRPSWGMNLPLMAETGVGDSYGDAK